MESKRQSGAEIAEFVRRHHVHYTVDVESGIGPGGRIPAGFDVRLFAVHPKGEHVAPHCPACAGIASRLRSLADRVVAPDAAPPEVDIEPVAPVLYDSRESPGTDEIALEIRVSHPGAHNQPIDEREQRRLGQIRERLKSFGIPEQG